MDFIFADDSRQRKPSRDGMGPLLAIGGLHIRGEKVGPLERAIRAHCRSIKFPDDEQFKWSPGKEEAYQRAHLREDKKTNFFVHLLGLAREHMKAFDDLKYDHITIIKQINYGFH